MRRSDQALPLATLETLRVIEARPNSGVFLRRSATESSFEAIVLLAEQGSEPTATEVRESIEVRAPLERQAITLACARHRCRPRCTAGDLAGNALAPGRRWQHRRL